mgnify:CR=1 FL=1
MNERTFTSDISRFGNIIRPDNIIINPNSVTFKKRNKNLFNFDEKTIRINNIASVEVNASILGTSIIIKSYGGDEIIGRKFNITDAKEIKKLIDNYQSK